MNLFNPDTLKNLCHTYGLRPTKQYGQNFLIDENVIDTIVKAAELTPDDTVVEVGPGFGVLTLALAPHVKKVVAFEIEKKLQPYWSRFCYGAKSSPDRSRGSSIVRNREILDSAEAESGGEIRNKKQETRNIEIVWGNVLRQRRDPLLPPPLWRGSGEPSPSQRRGQGEVSLANRYKLVANLPYQITSPVIRLFLESENPPTEMILMVQKEVAERICAGPGEMSLLSVSVQYYAEPEIVAVVPRSAFWPAPAVDSAILKIKKTKNQENNLNERVFFKIVKAGFSQRRKLLIKNLEPLAGKRSWVGIDSNQSLREIFKKLGLPPTARAQELSLEQWKGLAGAVIHLSEQ